MEQPKPTLQAGNAPRLIRRAEFEALLKNYRISDKGRQILSDTPFVAMVAPTSTGRNTIIKELVKTGHYHFIVSDTTRPPRQNDGVWEQDGVEYFFRKEDDMLADLQAGLFIEAEIIHSQQVSGISIREVKQAQDEGKVAITDVEILGGIAMAELKPDACLIYLVPPSFQEWLRRIHGRTPVSNTELRNRLKGAMKGFRLALTQERFVFIISRQVEETARIVDEVARLGIHHQADEAEACELVRTLYIQTEEYLKQLPS